MQLFTFKRRVDDFDSGFAKQRVPLLYAKSLPRRRVKYARNKRKNAHTPPPSNTHLAAPAESQERGDDGAAPASLTKPGAAGRASRFRSFLSARLSKPTTAIINSQGNNCARCRKISPTLPNIML